MTLLLHCRRCQKETSSAACDKTGLCAFCLCAEELAELRVEYGRVWAKRLRYLKAGIGLKSIDAQLDRVTRRMRDRVVGRVGKTAAATAILGAQIESARQPAATSRIVRPSLIRLAGSV